VHGDPYLELVSSGKEVIHVCCAVEAPVHDEMHLRHAKLGKGVQQVPQRPHVADVPWKLPVVHRKHALLAEEQGEVDLRKILAVTVVTVFDMLVESGVGGDTGDVEAQILGLRPVPQPCREEGLAPVLVQVGQKLADALRREHATKWVLVGLRPFGEMAQGVATAFVGDELPGGRIELADAALLVVRLLLFLIPEREHLVDVGGPVGMLVFDPVWFACIFRSLRGYYWNLFSHERQEEQSVNS